MNTAYIDECVGSKPTCEFSSRKRTEGKLSRFERLQNFKISKP
jgi:hypothetical protein